MTDRGIHAALEGAPLGLEDGRVRLAEHDPRWAPAAAALASALRARLPGEAVAIEHVGSTSVPGLAAKPILDLLLGIAPGTAHENTYRALETAGLVDRGEIAGPEADRIFTLENEDRIRVAHVHVVEHGGLEWAGYLAFRDALREDPSGRAAYDHLKRGLARSHAEDRGGYLEGKADFILDALDALVVD